MTSNGTRKHDTNMTPTLYSGPIQCGRHTHRNQLAWDDTQETPRGTQGPITSQFYTSCRYALVKEEVQIMKLR